MINYTRRYFPLVAYLTLSENYVKGFFEGVRVWGGFVKVYKKIHLFLYPLSV